MDYISEMERTKCIDTREYLSVPKEEVDEKIKKMENNGWTLVQQLLHTGLYDNRLVYNLTFKMVTYRDTGNLEDDTER